MFELIKKSLLASLGAAVISKEKVISATQRFVEQGKLSKEEADKLAHELVEGGKRQWDEIQEKITEIVKKGLEDLDIVKSAEFQELAERVDNLEKRLTILEDEAKQHENNPTQS